MTTVVIGSKRGSRASLVLSIMLIVFGLLATLLPIATSMRVVVVIGWLVIFNGLTQLVHAFQSKGVGHIGWKVLVAVLYLAAGGYLCSRPALGVASLTLALVIFLFAEGIADVVAYFVTGRSGNSPWMLLDGIVTVVLGFMIWKHWPLNSAWVMGTLVGISMVMTGTTRLMMAGHVLVPVARPRDDTLSERVA